METNVNNAIANTYLESFSALLQEGLSKIFEACAVYVKAIDEDPKLKQAFSEKFEGDIPSGAWASFEAVGRKKMHHKLLFGGGKNAKYIKRLPYSAQRAIMDGEPVKMVLPNGDSMLVDGREVGKDQAEQLFAGDHLRSDAEQAAYLKSLETAKVIESKRVAPAYQVRGGKVYVSADVVLTKEDIKKIAMEVL